MRARGSIPGELFACASCARPRLVERAGSSSSSRTAAASASTSPGAHDAPGAEAPHGLGDAADVVCDRRHAGAERAQQRAALIELRLVREEAIVASPNARSTSAGGR